MPWLAPRSCGVVSCLLLLPSLTFAQGVSIDHQGVGCVVAGKFPRFDARLDPSADVARARLNFRPEGGAHWYYVEMKPEAGVFHGILPKPQKSLHRFSYYIDVTDRAFHASRTAEFAPEVASGPVACGRQKVLAAGLAKANVLVHAPEGVAGAPALPPGFASDGVVTAGGGPAEGAVPASAGGGLGPAALILGGAAIAGGTAAVIATSKGGGGSADGGSSGGGSSPQPPTTAPSGPRTLTFTGVDTGTPACNPASCCWVNEYFFDVNNAGTLTATLTWAQGTLLPDLVGFGQYIVQGAATGSNSAAISAPVSPGSHKIRIYNTTGALPNCQPAGAYTLIVNVP
jgi:hypothetical protein